MGELHRILQQGSQVVSAPPASDEEGWKAPLELRAEAGAGRARKRGAGSTYVRMKLEKGFCTLCALAALCLVTGCSQERMRGSVYESMRFVSNQKNAQNQNYDPDAIQEFSQYAARRDQYMQERKEADQASALDLNYAHVLFVEAVQSDDASWCVYATVRHNDEGWDHYANAWQVLDPQGNELAWRLLAHPHEDEQPFTRDKCGIVIPPEVRKVTVRAQCKVHGFGGEEVVVDLESSAGEKFKVVRKR